MEINKLKPYTIQQRVLTTKLTGSKFFSNTGWFKKTPKIEWSEWKDVYSYSEASLKNGALNRAIEHMRNVKPSIEGKIEFRIIKNNGISS